MRWALLALVGLGCTEAGLYDRRQPPVIPDRVALTGRTCTEDARAARFPVKLVLVVDRAAGPLFSDFDPGGGRIRRLGDLVQSALTQPGFSLAVVGFAGRGQRLAPTEGAFSRNPGALLAAVSELALPQPCLGSDRCRDGGDGLRVAQAVIEDDLAASSAGATVLTRYVVVLVEAGPPRPAASARACCAPGDQACRGGADTPSVPCQTDQDLRRLAALRAQIEAAGAAGLVLHTLHLEATTDEAVRRSVTARHERLAFAGGGRALRVPQIEALDLTALGLFDRGGELRAKRLVIANHNALPGPGGRLLADSDGDGLSDADERAAGTDPERADTDGDGLTDLVERLTGFDPLVPDAPRVCEGLAPRADRDLDGLTDCDEAVLGTDPSLVDTDGDGLPDRLELVRGTDALNPDDLEDLDGDGVSNGDELREGTDARSADPPSRLGDAARYEIEDEGLRREPVADPFKFLNGIEAVDISPETTLGIGALRWTPGAPPTLEWRDAGEDGFGPAVPVTTEGALLRLPAASYAPVQGDAGAWIEVVARPREAPPRLTVEPVRVALRERQCLRWTVRNLRLVGTAPSEADPVGGLNALWIYFAQAPAGRPLAPGPFRIARIPVRYLPPDRRTPPGALLGVRADEYVSPRP